MKTTNRYLLVLSILCLTLLYSSAIAQTKGERTKERVEHAKDKVNEVKDKVDGVKDDIDNKVQGVEDEITGAIKKLLDKWKLNQQPIELEEHTDDFGGYGVSDFKKKYQFQLGLRYKGSFLKAKNGKEYPQMFDVLLSEEGPHTAFVSLNEEYDALNTSILDPISRVLLSVEGEENEGFLAKLPKDILNGNVSLKPTGEKEKREGMPCEKYTYETELYSGVVWMTKALDVNVAMMNNWTFRDKMKTALQIPDLGTKSLIVELENVETKTGNTTSIELQGTRSTFYIFDTSKYELLQFDY